MASEKDYEQSPQDNSGAPIKPTEHSAQPRAEQATSADAEAARGAFGWTYWMLNSIEAFERLAYFGIRAVVPVYIMQATEPGGLRLTALTKGWIYMWWAILQSWLPMFTGGIADRYGYKKVLAGAITANIVGYLCMAWFHNYEGFFFGILILATGTAFFKPALQGSIAQKLTKENSSLGWGIFYWVVNLGAFGAPFLATAILGQPHSAEGWRNLFLASAGYTAMNLLLLLTFRDVPSGASAHESLITVFGRTVENIWPFWFRGGKFHPGRGTLGLLLVVVGLLLVILKSDDYWHFGLGIFILGGLLATWLEGGTFTWQLRLPAFLAIMSCFWMMMYQLWDLHPNFIEDWVDSASVANTLHYDFFREYGDLGRVRVPQQILLNLNAGLIIILVVPISWMVRRMRALSSMLIGMTVATIGILVAGLSQMGWILLLGIAFFSLGEMLTGPKKNQYLGLIAPPGKKGLYLGYVNIPVGVGVGIGSIIAGALYGHYGERATLALKDLASDQAVLSRAVTNIDWSDSLDIATKVGDIDRSTAFNSVAEELGEAPGDAANYLRSIFRYDRGQIVNLATMWLAEHPLEPEEFVEAVNEAVTAKRTKAEKAGDDTADLPVEAMNTVPADFAARHGDIVLKALERDRLAALEIVQDRLNENQPEGEKLSLRAVAEELWSTYGDNPEVLNNLAIEYLAQTTDRVASAAMGMSFDKPVEDLPEKLGLTRPKAFQALSSANGAEPAKVDDALAELDLPDSERLYAPSVYLAQLKHRRFEAIGRRKWPLDVAALRSMVVGDAAAEAALVKAAAEEDMTVPADLKANGPEVEAFFKEVADEQPLVRAALDAKNWAAAPEDAAFLLQLNPQEARALVSAELSGSMVKTTQHLWDKYHPQYMVWIPFAAIGVLATIALAIFGQMAKKWADMNA